MPLSSRCSRLLALSAFCIVGCLSVPAFAQFAMVPSPFPMAPQPSQAESNQDYRAEAAKHLYAAYPMRVYKGRLPPLLYGIAMIETEVDVDGSVLDVRIRRPPGAAEIGPWIQQMIRKAAPFPAPAKLGKASFSEIWLVHKSGNFQLDALTEGQD